MKKRDIIAALAEFGDDDEIMMCGTPILKDAWRICGKRKAGTEYLCILRPGHTGKCFSWGKRIDFTPDEEHEPSASLNE